MTDHFLPVPFSQHPHDPPVSQGNPSPPPRLDDGTEIREGAEARVSGGGAERSEALPELGLAGDSLADLGGDQVGGLEDLIREHSRANRRRRKRRRVKVGEATRNCFTARERILLLDTWIRSKLPAKDYGALVGVTPHTLYRWKKLFLEEGPAGLADKPRRKMGCRLADEVKRAILMLKEAHPDWGQDRIAAVLARNEAFGVSPSTVGRFLDASGYQVLDAPTKPHPAKVRRFERAKPNQLWQTDLFTFTLKRENRRVHLVAYMDDFSRFIVGYGLHSTASGALVREVLESGIVNFGAPEEVLTDNGTQYHTWRGTSAFRKYCNKRGIKQVVASPRHPQTLGKIERFWQTLWGEILETAIFRGIEDARERIGFFVDYYNFHRTHQGIESLVPAERYFGAAQEVKANLEARVNAQAFEIAKNGMPRKAVHLCGRVGDSLISLHSEGGKVVLTQDGKKREEVDLEAPGRRADTLGGQESLEILKEVSFQDPLEEADSHTASLIQDWSPPDPKSYEADSDPLPPGVSPLDGHLGRIAGCLQPEGPSPPTAASPPSVDTGPKEDDQ